MLEQEFQRLGVQGDGLVQFGPSAALPHGGPGDRKLAAGDVVLIDAGCRVRGYTSDVTRTVSLRPALGRGPQGLRRRRPRPAAPASRRCAREPPPRTWTAPPASVIEDAGYGAFFTHRLGHGLGMDGHEHAVSRRAAMRTPLAAGNTVTIEPGIYLPGKFGVRIEDDYGVAAGGAPRRASRRGPASSSSCAPDVSDTEAPMLHLALTDAPGVPERLGLAEPDAGTDDGVRRARPRPDGHADPAARRRRPDPGKPTPRPTPTPTPKPRPRRPAVRGQQVRQRRSRCWTPANGKLVATAPIEKGSHEAELLADGKTVAVSGYGTTAEPGRYVILLDAGHGQDAARRSTSARARARTASKALQDGRLLVTAEGKRELVVVDPKTGEGPVADPDRQATSRTWSRRRPTGSAPTSPRSRAAA